MNTSMYDGGPTNKGGKVAKDESREPTTEGAKAPADETDGADEVLARHSAERHAMHAKHEDEHRRHEISGKGDKKSLHARHEKEMAGAK